MVSTPRRTGRLHILTVEDDEDTREVLTLGLELQGATVRAVGSATEALRAVQELGGFWAVLNEPPPGSLRAKY